LAAPQRVCVSLKLKMEHRLLCAQNCRFVWVVVLQMLAFMYCKYANSVIQNKLRLGYDIGKGFINCEEDILHAFPDRGEMKHSEKVKAILYERKESTMRALGER